MESNEYRREELRRMLNRLRDYKAAYMLFINNYDAPFTNNQTERDLRPCKTKQKVSGCFRLSAGSVSKFAVLFRVFAGRGYAESRKPLEFLVGDTGFESVTSSV
ncbi:MAG: transposase [Synergistaceae bacterium]|jgi:hypothetical protein|nr:transposase [Synergistaceae bacterium]